MRNLLVVVAVLIMSLTLISGKIDINFEHNLHAPKDLFNKNTVSYKSDWFGHRTYDIYLADEFNSSFPFRDTIKALDEARVGDTAIFHISGYGGQVDTTLLLINHIKNTKAHTVMIVEAPAYSAHAFLAFAGDELYITRYSYLMMHTSSAFNQDCSTSSGNDRGQTQSQVCEIMKQGHLINIEKYINEIPYLSSDQKKAIILGRTIILTPREMKPTDNLVKILEQ